MWVSYCYLAVNEFNDVFRYEELIFSFSEPSASKPVPAKSDTSISNVIVVSSESFVVNEPPVFKPSPAVIVIVESLIPAKKDPVMMKIQYRTF